MARARDRTRTALRTPFVIHLQDFIMKKPFARIVLLWLLAYVLVGAVFVVIYVVVPGGLMKGTAAASWDDALSFSFVTQATIGYGDVTPQGWLRLVANIQAVIGTGLNGAALGLITFRILRRPQPIRAADRIAFAEVGPGAFSFWLRFISVDSQDLIDVTADLTFVTDGTHSNARYDSVGGQVGELVLASVPPLITIAFFADTADEPFALHAPDSVAMDNNSKIPIHPNMFVANDAVDLAARLLFRVRGYQGSTGELFAYSKEYFAKDVLCGAFQSINNNVLGGTPATTRRDAAERLFDQMVPRQGGRCVACSGLVVCPFTRPVDAPSVPSQVRLDTAAQLSLASLGIPVSGYRVLRPESGRSTYG